MPPRPGMRNVQRRQQHFALRVRKSRRKKESIRNEPNKTDSKFRDGLSTWRIHKRWPDLALHFRAYRLLLDYFIFRWPRRTLQDVDRELFTLTSIIEEMLDELAPKMEGTIENESNVAVSINWTPRSNQGVLESLTARPIPTEEDQTLRMSPRGEVGKEAVICKFFSYLKRLEGLLAEKSSAKDLGIIKPHSKIPRMVGWTLTGQSIENATPRALTEKSATIPSEARLGIPGCGMRDVEENFVMREGKFRGIAYLEMQFEGQDDNNAFYYGTGWLIDKTTIATAGHCVYDPNMGFLKSVNVTFGHGISNPTRCHGTHAVVHWAWYRSFSQKSDLAFIRLSSVIDPKDTPALSYIHTPVDPPREVKLIARGYPDGLTRMQESQCRVKYNLEEADWSLEYHIDTDYGSSGCPIFDRDENVVAIHSGFRTAKGTYRQGQRTNHGAILDDEDNDADAFRAVLEHLGQERMEAALKFVFQGMSTRVTRYTVEDYGVGV